MASALLASRDEAQESRWAERKVYMRKGGAAAPGKTTTKPGFNSQPPPRGGQNGGNRLREEPPVFMDGAAASDDSSSLNRKSISINREARKESNAEAYITYNVSAYSKEEIRELRRKLKSQLEQVRSMYSRVEARETHIRGGGVNANASYSASQFSGNDMRNYGAKEVTSGLATGGQRPPALQLNLAAIDSSGDGAAAKEKRTPKVNPYYLNSEFVMGKDKMPPPPPDNKKGGMKRTAQSKSEIRETKRSVAYPMNGKILQDVMKQCGFLLSRLIKHKHGWVFKAPVDTVALGLHDYNTIIKQPMDLGTAKAKLNANEYKSPQEFAGDIRLTFNNAMTYNPNGHEVHIMAEQMLQFFEDRWKPICDRYEEEKRKLSWSGNDGLLPGASQNMKKLPFGETPKKNLKKTEPLLGLSPRPPPNAKSKANQTLRAPAPKKPKAKDLHKREMTFEEKQKLSASLQGLPTEKLENIVQIIKKRNPALCQQEDEIEVDIDSFDTETLWELDRFVNNCKKSMSKNKKKANGAEQLHSTGMEDVAARERSPVASGGETPKKHKKGEQGEEDVDIDGDMPSTNFPPVEIDMDGGYASKSSSSSSSSSDSGSSSSDSDSGSSSGSDSDADDAHSPVAHSPAGGESKALPRN